MAAITQVSDLITLSQDPSRVVNDPIKIDNATIGAPINLRYFIFKQDVSITNSSFTDSVDFSFATFERSANFSGTKFQGETKFRAAQAKYDFEITRAQFSGGASFMDIHVQELLRAEGAQFGGSGKHSTYFNRAKITKDALFCPYDVGDEFIPVSFTGRAHFPGTQILGTAKFDAAQFQDTVDFEHALFGGDAYFIPVLRGKKINSVCFHGNASFWGARFQSNAEFDGARFLKDADFELVQIENNAHFRHYVKKNQDTNQKRARPIVFRGYANFLNMRVKGTANFSGARFRGKAIFAHMQCESPAYFSNQLQTAGPVSGRFYSEAHFQSARFERGADFQGVFFKREAVFNRAEVKGAALFQGATFSAPASFKDATFKVVSFRDGSEDDAAEWKPQFLKTVNMIGFSYERIEVDVRELLSNKLHPYHRQPYTQLQKSLRALGEDRTADRVYLEQRRCQHKRLRERVLSKSEDLEKRRGSRGVLSYLSDFIQRHLFNYGIRPLRLLVISLVVILLGSFIFWIKGSVVLRDKKERLAESYAVEKPPTSEKPAPEEKEDLSFTQAVGVSFNQFIPIVEIPSGSKWKPSTELLPKMNLGFLSFSFYGTLHRLAGAILVPLGVAALAGMLQRKEKPGK
jgi:uncharacterized protein YjbI with pentapeptide repeats